MQVKQRENEEKARKLPWISWNTQPDGRSKEGTERSSSIWEGCRSIHEPVSGAVLDDRNDAVPLHGKIQPAREY